MKQKNKKYVYAGIGIFVLALLIFSVPKYFNGNVTASNPSSEISGEIEKIEIIHFHGTNQCSSCITMGDFAEETVKTHFKDELDSGKITFDHLNGELPENKEKAKKYGATGSSLWIGTYYKDGTFEKEQDTNVWYKINNKQDFMNYLKGVIKEKLSGN